MKSKKISERRKNFVMQESSKKMVCAYLSDWGWIGLSDEAAACLTHVNYAFALLDGGRVSDAHWRHGSELDEAIRRYPALTFVLSVGGWGAGGFSEAASTEEGRALFASSAVAVMRRHGFRGIDVDWEYPCHSEAGIASSADDKQNFTYLLQTLRDRLDRETELTGETYLLSIAVGAAAVLTEDIEPAKIGAIVDYVNLMTYDMQEWERVTHHSNLYPSAEYTGGWSAVQSVQAYHACGIEKEKLVIGGAFYGHSYAVSGAHPLGCTDSIERTENLSYSSIRRECTEENGWKKYRDATAHAPYLYNGDKIVLYDDAQVFSEKVDYIFENGLGGIMFWEFNEDDTGELVRAIADAAIRHDPDFANRRKDR